MTFNLPQPASTIYLSRYIKLIVSAKTSAMPDIGEVHHILPKSMGGGDDHHNLVRLTPRMHYLAHWMLWKAYKTREMTIAFYGMSNQSNPHQHRVRRLTAKGYEILRNDFRKAVSNSTSSLWQDPEYRNKHKKTNATEKTKKLRSEKGKALWVDPVYREKVLQSRAKARLAGRVRIDHSKCSKPGDKNPMRNPETRAKVSGANHYSRKEGYIRPTCVYCGCTSTPTNIKRWHNENCKQKV